MSPSKGISPNNYLKSFYTEVRAKSAASHKEKWLTSIFKPYKTKDQ